MVQGQVRPVLADHAARADGGMSDPDRAAAKRAMEAMMGMRKIDIAAIERARAGSGGMSLVLFGHPFSSYTMKALIALYENETPFEFRILDPDHPDHGAELVRRWPIGKFPLLVDGTTTVFETSAIIEHLEAFHPGPVRLIPADAKDAVPVRMLDRVFDSHVMTPMQAIVADALRPADARDPFGVTRARSRA